MGILAAIILFVTGIIFIRKRRRRGLYYVVWRNSSSLKPHQVMDIRGRPGAGYKKYYFPRAEAELIRERIRDNRHVLVIGNPLAGKTRIVFETLRSLKTPRDVVIPRIGHIATSDIEIPLHFRRWRKKILLLDDLDKFFAGQKFEALFNKFLQDKDTLVVATCRSGPELEVLRGKNQRELEMFGEPIEIPKVEKELGERVACEAGQKIPEAFDGNIGSIFLPLETMKVRYQELGNAERAILRSISRLYMAGVYSGRQVFTVERVKRVCRQVEGFEERREYIWNEFLKNLDANGFLEIQDGNLQAEEAHLEFAVEDIGDKLQNLRHLFDVFKDDADAIFKIGDRSNDIGRIDLQKRDFMKLAIDAYTEALKVLTATESPEHYCIVQNNLGLAYGRLAQVEDTAANCKRAIETFAEGLRAYTLEGFPMLYGVTQNNLGNAYVTLAEVEDKVSNCRRAIEAFAEALKVRTLDDFPMDYGMTQNNLGNAYRTLAEVEDKGPNCKRAIEAYAEALKIRTLDDFPMGYGMTQNNLGNAYRTLAEVEDKGPNCKRAIEAYAEALKVRTLDGFPMQYGMTQNNLGNAYSTLAEVEDKGPNCKRAIEAYAEALKVYTLDDFPMDYDMTQNNLGTAYRTLAEVEDKGLNCKRAIEAYAKALKARTLDGFPMQYGMTQNNLGTAYRTLAEVEDKGPNCRRAIDAYAEALKVWTLDDFPMDYGITQNNLGNAYRTLAEIEDKGPNCKRAIEAYAEALKIRTLENFPMQYGMTQSNLGNAYRTLADVEDKAGNCKRAREAYEEALKVFIEQLPEPHGLVKQNLERLAGFCEGE